MTLPPHTPATLNERVDAWLKQFAIYKKAEQTTFLEQEADKIIQLLREIMQEVLDIVKPCDLGTYRGVPIISKLDVVYVVDIIKLLTTALGSSNKDGE